MYTLFMIPFFLFYSKKMFKAELRGDVLNSNKFLDDSYEFSS